MQTARASVSSGRLARVRRACTCGIEAYVRHADEGIKLVRWIAGPGIVRGWKGLNARYIP